MEENLTLDSLVPLLPELIPSGPGEVLEHLLPPCEEHVLRDSASSFEAPAGLGGISTLRLKANLRASHQSEGPEIS